MGEAVWRTPSPRLHVEIDAALRSPVGSTQEFHTETELRYRAESRVVESITHRICDPTVRPELSSRLHLSRSNIGQSISRKIQSLRITYLLLHK